MKRPSDHIDAGQPDIDQPDADRAPQSAAAPLRTEGDAVTQPRLGPVGYARFAWRALTSMRTALVLLLLLALAAIPGSLVPQRSSDPNAVLAIRDNDRALYDAYESLQLFDVYTSAWFSAIYLLLFLSLIGCVLPRAKHHLDALRSRPPRTPARLSRLADFTTREAATDATTAIDAAHADLRKRGYRVERVTTDTSDSVSAERGYARETGNLVFHSALVAILVTVAVGSGFNYSGQKLIIEGTSFTNVLTSYDSFNRGRFVDDSALEPFSIRLESFDAEYGLNLETRGPQPTDFTAEVVTTTADGAETERTLKVNAPLDIEGTSAYLLGNGFAPVITVRDAEGDVAFSQPVPFLPQDANLSSVGVVKVPDAQPTDLGFVGFFYPSWIETSTGAFTSIWPEPDQPLLTLDLYTGDLGLDEGLASNAYVLDVDGLDKRTGRDTGVSSLVLAPGETVELPDGLGSITFEELRRFVSVDVHRDVTQEWMLLFSGLAIAGLLTSLFIPRRRMWVRATPRPEGGVDLEYAGLARGDDPGLAKAVEDLADRHSGALARSASAPGDAA